MSCNYDTPVSVENVSIPQYISRFTIVSREAKKKRYCTRRMSELFTGSTMHACTQKYADAVTKPP